MRTEQELKTLKRAILVYGVRSQVAMAHEEMAELAKALCKHYRTNALDERISTYQNILEEIADVQIMLDQLRIMFGGTKEIEEEKIRRLKLRLDQVEDEG